MGTMEFATGPSAGGYQVCAAQHPAGVQAGVGAEHVDVLGPAEGCREGDGEGDDLGESGSGRGYRAYLALGVFQDKRGTAAGFGARRGFPAIPDERYGSGITVVDNVAGIGDAGAGGVEEHGHADQIGSAL